MSTLERNLALITTIPEEQQEEIQRYLLLNFCTDNPYKPLSKAEILDELASARLDYINGKGEDFDKAIDEIGLKYGI